MCHGALLVKPSFGGGGKVQRDACKMTSTQPMTGMELAVQRAFTVKFIWYAGSRNATDKVSLDMRIKAQSET